MILMGFTSILLGFITHNRQLRLKKNGLLSEAKMIYFSDEKSDANEPSVKIPVFTFSHEDENGLKKYFVKGKTNSSCKIGEVTPIYYNPKNPEKEYYLPQKDFLMKYLMFFIGLFFFCLGVLYLLRSLNYSTEEYFLYLIISLFAGTFLLFAIGKANDVMTRKK